MSANVSSLQAPELASKFHLNTLAATSTTVLAAASAPTPLYHVYQAAWGFSHGTLTFVYGIYALSLLFALLTAGSLSDYVGRRPAILGALLLEAIAMVLFIAADGLPVLLVARALQGLATGVALSAVGAALLDLDRVRGAMINNVAPMLGLAAGALGCSLLVQFAPAPMRLIYVLLLLAFLTQGLAVWICPETARPQPGVLASLRPSVRIPSSAKRIFLLVAPITVAVWALLGFYLSLGPTLALTITRSTTPITAGLLVCAFTLSAAAAVFFLRLVPSQRVMSAGALSLAFGVFGTLLGVAIHIVALFWMGAVVAGFGFGAGFQGAFRSLMPLAAAHERAGLLSAFLILSYLAMSVPAMVAGFLVKSLGITTTTNRFGIALIILSLASFIAAARRSR